MESKEGPAPNKPEPHQHPGEPGATTVHPGDSTALSPVLSRHSSGSDFSPVPPRLGPAGIQFFLVSRVEVAVQERSPEPAPVSPFPGQLEQGMVPVPLQERCLELTLEWLFPGRLKQGMAAVPPWEGISWILGQAL